MFPTKPRIVSTAFSLRAFTLLITVLYIIILPISSKAPAVYILYHRRHVQEDREAKTPIILIRRGWDLTVIIQKSIHIRQMRSQYFSKIVHVKK